MDRYAHDIEDFLRQLGRQPGGVAQAPLPGEKVSPLSSFEAPRSSLRGNIRYYSLSKILRHQVDV
jgi:hypothetical protein